MNILFDEEKNVSYFYLNGNDSDKLLTSDGIICDISLFKRFTKDGYKHYKTNYNNKRYDFNKSNIENRLVELPKRIKIEDVKTNIEENKNVSIDNKLNVEDELINVDEKKHRGRPKGSKNKPKEINSIVIEETSIKDKIISKFEFEIISKMIMLVTSIGTAILSIYFTGIYMSNINGNKFIGFLLSSVMFLYGLIGSQYADILKEQKRHIMSFVFLITSLLTIGFSMCTSLFVNGEKYFDSSIIMEQTINSENVSNNYTFDILNDEIEENKQSIEDLRKQNETLSTKWSQVWDSEKKMTVVREGIISEVATKQINENNNKIVELQNRNKEIRDELKTLSTSGVLEDSSKRLLSFEDFIGKYLHFDGRWIRLFLLIFASIFIDLISPLSLSIVRHKNKTEN